MNKQKDAVQDVWDTNPKLPEPTLAFALNHFCEHGFLRRGDAGIFAHFAEKYIRQKRAALKSNPVDVDVDKFRKTEEDILGNHEWKVQQAIGWNACLYHFTQNGYRITKEG